MNFKTLFALVLALNFISCKSKHSQQDAAIETKIKEWVNTYNFTTNIAYLDSSYNLLTENKYFHSHLLTAENLDFIAPIYFNTGRYDELLKLLAKSEGINRKFKNEQENFLKSLVLLKKGNFDKGDEFIRKNITEKQIQFDKNKRDSIAFLELYMAKAMITSRAEIFKEIDSVNQHSAMFSNMFFEKMLKPQIDKQYAMMPKFAIHKQDEASSIKATIKNTAKALELSNQWKKDTNGCMKLRSKEMAESLLESYGLKTKSLLDFKKVFGKPDQFVEKGNQTACVYFLECIYSKGKVVRDSKIHYVEFFFKNDKYNGERFYSVYLPK